MTASGEDPPAERALLVDAGGGLAARMREPLESADYEVVIATSASESLDRLGREDYAVVVAAADLPDLEGVRLLRSIRISYPALPLLLAPENGSEELAADAIRGGASGYIPSEADEATAIAHVEEARQRSSTQVDDEERRRYRHVIELSPAPINIFDPDGESIWCNDATLELLGLQGREEIIGHPIFEFIHPDDHDLAETELETVVEGKQPAGPTRMRLLTPDGEVRYVSVTTATGQFLGMDVGQAIIIDETDRELRDRQLTVLDQWLRHNIRNEMSIVQGVAESIETGLVEDVSDSAATIRRHAEKVVRQAAHERRVVQLLSDPPSVVPIDVVAVLEDSLPEWQAEFPEADISIERRATPTVEAIPAIDDAVDELVRNAVVHADTDAPTVTVTIDREEDRGLVRVADDGPGIPEDELSTLTTDAEITPLSHGTGLGLTFVSWVVRLSGGTVAGEATEPRGSVVTIRLPLADG